MEISTEGTADKIRNQYLDTVFRENPLLTRLIGLSPLLAISYSLTLSLAMGITFFIVFTLTSLLVSATRNHIPSPIALACYVLITATIITAIDLLMQGWYPELRSALGIYLPIVALNCLIIDRTTVFASNNNIFHSLKDAVFHSFAVMLVLILLGSFRELMAYGSLLKDMQLLSGEQGKELMFQLSSNYKGFSLAAHPAGAFISLGLLIAFGDFLSTKLSSKPQR